MIDIRVVTSDGDDFNYVVKAIPRIGESVMIGHEKFTVVDVVHALSSDSTSSGITIKLNYVKEKYL